MEQRDGDGDGLVSALVWRCKQERGLRGRRGLTSDGVDDGDADVGDDPEQSGYATSDGGEDVGDCTTRWTGGTARVRRLSSGDFNPLRTPRTAGRE